MARVSSDRTYARVELVYDNFPQVAGDIRDAVSAVIGQTAELIASSAKELINTGPKTGIVYHRRGRPDHQASAPGEAPAADLNALANSIQTDRVDDLEVDVLVGAEQGAALEFGRRDGTIAPRPYMTPAAEEARDDFQEALARAIRGAAGESACSTTFRGAELFHV